MATVIRPAGIADAPGIARVHWDIHRTTYVETGRVARERVEAWTMAIRISFCEGINTSRSSPPRRTRPRRAVCGIPVRGRCGAGLYDTQAAVERTTPEPRAAAAWGVACSTAPPVCVRRRSSASTTRWRWASTRPPRRSGSRCLVIAPSSASTISRSWPRRSTGPHEHHAAAPRDGSVGHAVDARPHRGSRSGCRCAAPARGRPGRAPLGRAPRRRLTDWLSPR